MATTLEAVAPGAEQIAAQVRRLADLRRRQGEVNAKIEERRAAFEESIKFLTEEAKQLASERASAEAMLRASAVANYEQTHDTRPTAGVQVKLYTHLEYDEEKADEWTRQHRVARIPERLDRREFEQVAKAMQLPFVEETQVPKATIARDLDKALGEAAQ